MNTQSQTVVAEKEIINTLSLSHDRSEVSILSVRPQSISHGSDFGVKK